MNKAAQYFDLPPYSRLLDLMEGDYNLVTDIPALTGVAQLPPNWQYIGPVFARLDGDVPLQIRELPRDKPLIYFAMGSSANRKVLLEVLGMFEGLPYTVIAPIKAHLAGGDVRVPGNVHVFDWLPAHKVNPLADTAVIHGGQGTVQTACVSGTPFVGIGLQPEQDINIELVARYGTAVRLPKYRVTREKLQANIEYLLHDRQVRQRARALQETMRSWDGPSKAARFLVDTFGDAHDV